MSMIKIYIPKQVNADYNYFVTFHTFSFTENETFAQIIFWPINHMQVNDTLIL